MTNSALHDELRAIVRRHGLDTVDRALREIRQAERRDAAAWRAPSVRGPTRNRNGGREKPNAVTCVGRMELPADRRSVLAEAATRYNDKAFLPIAADIRDFCENRRIPGTPPKSRAAAIPRLFGFMAMTEAGAVQEILDSGYYSGPSRLGPIADAIRELSRERIRAYNERNGLPDNPESVSAAGAEDTDGAADDRS